MPLQPIKPFEPTSTDQYQEDPIWIAQIKWDGVRVLTYYDGQELKLYNRKKNERTLHYPELRNVTEYCTANSVILDGEIIAFEKGKPSFYEVMKRDGITKIDKVGYVMRSVPITYMIFDILFYNGQWVTPHPLSERQNILSSIIKPNACVQLVENYDDAKALFEVIKKHDMEGILMKDLSSTYVIDGKDGRWRKKKYYRDMIAVVGGVTLKNGIVNSLLLGLYDQDDRFRYIGHAGTGKLTQKDWVDLTEGMKPIIQTTTPFINRPPRLKGTVWVKPILTVKVNFAEWKSGHSLRQPSIQSFVEVPAQECRF